MATREDIQKLLNITNRRFQKLREKKAHMGINTPVHIETQIEDVEKEIEQLETELAAITDKSQVSYFTEKQVIAALFNTNSENVTIEKDTQGAIIKIKT